jgi:hypothetical protein
MIINNMEILEYNEVMKEIIREYDKKPEGWCVLIGRSSRGFYDLLFSNPQEVWQLKLDTIYKPNPMGFGVKLEVDPSKVLAKGFPSYGFRPISAETMDLMKNMIDRSMKDLTAVMVKSILKIPPVSTKEIKGITAVGPYIQQPSLDPISPKQKELSTKLDRELEKLMREKYPLYY